MIALSNEDVRSLKSCLATMDAVCRFYSRVKENLDAGNGDQLDAFRRLWDEFDRALAAPAGIDGLTPKLANQVLCQRACEAINAIIVPGGYSSAEGPISKIRKAHFDLMGRALNAEAGLAKAISAEQKLERQLARSCRKRRR